MEIRLKQRRGSNVISRYRHFLHELYEVLSRLQISIEEIIVAKIDAIPKRLLYSDVEVVTPEIIMLTLDNKLRIIDYDKTIDISKLSLRYSELRMHFLGSLHDIRAVFHISIEYTGKAEIKGHTNELDFDDFEKLLERALIRV